MLARSSHRRRARNRRRARPLSGPGSTPRPTFRSSTYLVFKLVRASCHPFAPRDSFVSASENWTQVSSQPASVVCAATPCAQTFSVVDPAPGQTETLTVAMVAESQAAGPGAPLLSGPVERHQRDAGRGPRPPPPLRPQRQPRAPRRRTTSTSSTSSTTRAPTTTTSTSSTLSSHGAPPRPPARRHRSPRRPRCPRAAWCAATRIDRAVDCPAWSWQTYAGIRCVTGNDPAGYVVVDGHVYAGQPGDPATFKGGLCMRATGPPGTHTSRRERRSASRTSSRSSLGDNLIPLVGGVALGAGADTPVLISSSSRPHRTRRSGIGGADPAPTGHGRRTGRHKQRARLAF